MVAKLDGTNGLLQQYDYQAPSTGFSYTFAAGVNVLVMNPAGTLATGTITMPASPADGMTISFSSTQTITALTVNANTGQSIVRKPTSFGAGSAMTFVYRLSNTTWYPMTNYATAGTVLQVVSTTLTSTQSTTSGTPTDITNFSATITPSSASNKVLVFVTTQFSGPTNGYGYFLLLRGSTSIGLGTGATGLQVNVFLSSGYVVGVASFGAASNSFLDSPATTSATTYKIQFASANPPNAFYINRQASTDNGSYINFPTSSITLMEIAA